MNILVEIFTMSMTKIFIKCRQLHVTARPLSSIMIDFVFDNVACDLSLSILIKTDFVFDDAVCSILAILFLMSMFLRCV